MSLRRETYYAHLDGYVRPITHKKNGIIDAVVGNLHGVNNDLDART